MKTTGFYVLCMLVSALVYGQKQDLSEIKVTAPVYNSEVYKSLDEFMTVAIEYPADAKKQNRQGTVIIGFTVTTGGETADYKIVNSVYHSLDNEVIRALSVTDGKW